MLYYIVCRRLVSFHGPPRISHFRKFRAPGNNIITITFARIYALCRCVARTEDERRRTTLYHYILPNTTPSKRRAVGGVDFSSVFSCRNFSDFSDVLSAAAAAGQCVFFKSFFWIPKTKKRSRSDCSVFVAVMFIFFSLTLFRVVEHTTRVQKFRLYCTSEIDSGYGFFFFYSEQVVFLEISTVFLEFANNYRINSSRKTQISERRHRFYLFIAVTSTIMVLCIERHHLYQRRSCSFFVGRIRCKRHQI